MNPNQVSSRKRVGCLCLAFLKQHGKPGEWDRFYRELCREWSKKAVHRMMEKLGRSGLISYSVMPHLGFLSGKGEDVFMTLKGQKVA